MLRPGGVSIEALRTCPGWEDVAVGYKDYAETNDGVGEGVVIRPPRAPGMKYKHYSPRARVVLVRGELKKGNFDHFVASTGRGNLGVIGTRKWIREDGRMLLFFGDGEGASIAHQQEYDEDSRTNGQDGYRNLHHSRIPPFIQSHLLPSSYSTISTPESDPTVTTTTTTTTATTTTKTTTKATATAATAQKIYSINIGPSLPAIAHGLFSALRELDLLGVEVIFVESLDDDSGKEEGGGGENGMGEGAAVMNRLRKAAEFELR